jgi:hypothetical protein
MHEEIYLSTGTGPAQRGPSREKVEIEKSPGSTPYLDWLQRGGGDEPGFSGDGCCKGHAVLTLYSSKLATAGINHLN